MSAKLPEDQERFFLMLHAYFAPRFDREEWPEPGEVAKVGLALKESGLFPDLTLKDLDEVYIAIEAGYPVQCAA